jgi:hypothetical protein
MRLDEIEWEYQGDSVRVGMTWHGQGASVLMLPALSSRYAYLPSLIGYLNAV